MPAKKSYAMFARATVLPRGYVVIHWRRSHQHKPMPFSVSWGEIVFSVRPGSEWNWPEKLDAELCPHGPVRFRSSWTSLKRSRPMHGPGWPWSSLPPPHVGTQTPDPRPGTIRNGPMRYVMMIPRSSFTALIVVSANLVLCCWWFQFWCLCVNMSWR